MEDAFAFVGQAFGEIIRLLVDALTAFFSGLDEALGAFLGGLAESLGIAPRWLSLAVLAFGLWLLWRALCALRRRAPIATLIWALLGVTVLSWLIY